MPARHTDAPAPPGVTDAPDAPVVPEVPGASPRARWRAVAVPSEHGGWGLTLEPVLLGLAVAPSWAGLLIGLAAFAGFVTRTPAKLVAVDRRRGRWLPRTTLAARIATGEVLVIAVLVAGATALAGWRWWPVAAAAAPLVAVEWWFDVRSHGRRLVPELCGAVGVSATAAAIAVASHTDIALAIALWMVLAARSIAAIPFVRSQIVLARRGVLDLAGSDRAQALAVALGAAAVVLTRDVLAGAVALGVVAATHLVWSRRRPPPVKVIGVRQMLLGLLVVSATAIGALS